MEVLNKKLLEKFNNIYAKEIGNNKITKELVRDALHKAIVTSDSTFEQRKSFLESLLGKADINKKLRFGNLPSFGELATGLAEPITEGHEFGDIILVIRTKGDLVAVQPKKGDVDYHPSYPWVIRSLNKDGSIADVETLLFDKSYNAVDVFPEVTNASGKKLKYEEYKKVYGDQAKSRYLNYMGAGPMSTNVSESVLTEAKPKQPVSKSQKVDGKIKFTKKDGTKIDVDLNELELVGPENIDFESNIFSFESSIDSHYLENSIATWGTENKVYFYNGYYMFDNSILDRAGAKSAIANFNKGYNTFLWRKFELDYPELIQYKDLNEIDTKSNFKPKIETLMKYYSKNENDFIYL